MRPHTARTWLITGAGRGLGRKFAQAALEQGDRLVGTVRRPGPMAEILAEYPKSVQEILLDVRDTKAITAAVDEAAQAFGGLDVVVNNAGSGVVGALEGFSEALSAEVSQFGIRVTIAPLGGFATDWAGSSMPFASPMPEYNELRTNVFGTAQIPWPTADPDAPSTDSDPSVAAKVLITHLSEPDRSLRVLIGDDVCEQAALAYAARRDSYGARREFNWPT